MKKTLIAIIAVLVIVSIAVTVINVSADDATVAEGDSAFGVMESFTESETAEELSTKIEESFEETDTGIDAGELNQAISNSQSKTEAIINIADMFGIPTAITTAEGPALGAAILAMVGAGIHASVPEACAKIITLRDEFAPDMAAHVQYRPYYSVYKKLYTDLRDTYKILAKS